MKKRKINLKKIREEEQAIGATYQEYIQTFEATTSPLLVRKTFVKSATLYSHKEESCSDKETQLYQPEPIVKLRRTHTQPLKTIESNRNEKRSNLRSLGDELKMLQNERKLLPKHQEIKTAPVVVPDDLAHSTNLYISNLKPTITERDLMHIFGTFGPLASVKIMWPRKHETYRDANCGFVAYMNRADAETALKQFKSNDEIRVKWGKAIRIPSYPVYISNDLFLKLYTPSPPSQLPFNAQNQKGDIRNATIKVVIPFNRARLARIHRMIEFVINYGAEFEIFILSKEYNNPDFEFLYNYKSPEHIYYRWKLFSLLMGDSKSQWSLRPFRMYKNGSIWLPPTPIDYQNYQQPADNQQLIELLRDVTMNRDDIAKVAELCLDRQNSFEILSDSLMNPSTDPLKKIARLYVLSDLIHNYRRRHVVIGTDTIFEIFQKLHQTYKSFKFEEDRHNFKSRIVRVLKAWTVWQYFNSDFIRQLEAILLYGNCKETSDRGENLLRFAPLESSVANKFDMFL